MFEKSKPNCTPLDRMIAEKFYEVRDAEFRLKSAAENVIVANGVIDLYPMGADKAQAIEDAEAHKHFLLCAIGSYDELMQEYRDLLKREGARETTAEWINAFRASHEVIEVAYRNFWKK